MPVIFGDATVAARMAETLLSKGIYVIAFSYPVVPLGKARIRTQISAAHTSEDLEFAVAKFAEGKAPMPSAITKIATTVKAGARPSVRRLRRRSRPRDSSQFQDQVARVCSRIRVGLPKARRAALRSLFS